MKSNPNLYDDYDDLKGWNTLFQPSTQEAQLYSKEFKHIDFSDSYFLDIGFEIQYALRQTSLRAC